ncbi:MAG: DoxX family protein [Cyclobacteriaceae bacterium]|nr:DoxX family protein [Cyclobacteriaceae bacterium]
MKATNRIYWIATGLFAAFMLASAIPDIMMIHDAKAQFDHLGYPLYFIPFIGVMKVLGVVAILVPGYPKIREWAYAGLCFDLIGAVYSMVSVDGLQDSTFVMIVPIGLMILSYIYNDKRATVRLERSYSFEKAKII